ncbi:uncharacterized protein ColSpa_11450 [Colletotrichum spaethianum]|uniref:Uncharacterized protein n=1 Tax=Colletotrichum spaethianum TaxID=700344 RepID=A0AA37UKG9_9PEZI|nr:uncharacterized protein ColSpa_11450 [Colletotrichum spaethianum]GKT51269.1 hypothetical protein ColSpa_11450 [Colletotrichum spaethianum]
MSCVNLHLEDDGAPAFASKVIDKLNHALASTISTSPDEAAAALDALLGQDYAQHGTAGSFLWWFWDLVHDLARQVPYDSPQQDRLVAVIKALTCLPCNSVNLGEEWGASDENSVAPWAKFPMFGNTLGEKLDDGDLKAPGEYQRKERRVNLQAYAARVMGLCLVPLETYAIWALVDALEGAVTPVRGAPDATNPDPAAVEDISYKARSAASWMVHAGHVLHGRDEEIRGVTAGPLWKLDKKEATKLRRKFKGTNGLCPQRWQLWKERFVAVRDAEGLDGRAREDAGNAFAVMEKVEKSQ